jgi:hypothetical protein
MDSGGDRPLHKTAGMLPYGTGDNARYVHAMISCPFTPKEMLVRATRLHQQQQQEHPQQKQQQQKK